MRPNNLGTRCFCVILASFFVLQSFQVSAAEPAVLNLPAPGTMVATSEQFVPAIVKGINFYPNDPLKFDFIIDTGHSKLSGPAFKDEANKLIKYFLASLTVPDKEVWVNLSPYEKDRIVPENLGVTEMGRDMLAQDYLLKQLTSSLIYPEKGLGKEFWGKVYAQAKQKLGKGANLPVSTFNKVWIVPDKAVVWEHEGSVYVVESHLKVMMEEDFLATQKNVPAVSTQKQNKGAAQVVREIILPEIEKEVNQGRNFANLRQIFNSMILATWYKQNLRETILGKVYVNQNKVAGVDVEDRQIKQKIYEQYLQAFKKGVYNYIKEEVDPLTRQSIPRKYFAGGVIGVTPAMISNQAMLGAFEKLPAKIQSAVSGTIGTSVRVIANFLPSDRNRRTLAQVENAHRRYSVIANWKMAVSTEAQAEALARDTIENIIAKLPKDIVASDMDIILAPSVIHVPIVRKVLNEFEGKFPKGLISLAAQDVSFYKPGALTGQISMEQLKDYGVKYVILGHSERRGLAKETSAEVNAKAKRAQELGLISIVAVGESLRQQRMKLTIPVLLKELWQSLKGLDPNKLMVAYEPIWAIGTGKDATPLQANSTQRFIRRFLIGMFGVEAARKIRIHYGGSVKPGNAVSLIEEDEVEGFLVGGASLKGGDFSDIAVHVARDITNKIMGRVPQSVSVPKNFSSSLAKKHNLRTEKIEYIRVSGNGELNLKDEGVSYALKTAVAAALGSFFQRGLGRKTKSGFDVKKALDGNSVQMIEDETDESVEENKNIATLESSSEGLRDGAPASRLGRIRNKQLRNHLVDTADFTEKGRVAKFDLGLYQSTIKLLKAFRVTIFGKNTDALEKTEGAILAEAKDQPTDSWALSAVTVIEPNDEYMPKPIDDNFRTAGISYNAPRRAEIGPLDLPFQVVPAIARAWGFEEGTKEYVDFMNHVTLVSLGPREVNLEKDSGNERHAHIIQDSQRFKHNDGILSKYQFEHLGSSWDKVSGLLIKYGWADPIGEKNIDIRFTGDLKADGDSMRRFLGDIDFQRLERLLEQSHNNYPGMRVEPVSDGDLMPRIMAELGPNELNDYRHVIVLGRTGATEGEGAAKFTVNVKGARMVKRQVSAIATKDKVAYSTANGYTDQEVQEATMLGYTQEDLTRVSNAEEQKIKTIVVMAANTGGTSHLGENFRNTMRRVRVDEKNQQIQVMALLKDADGNVFVVRVTQESPNVQQSIVSINSATKESEAVMLDAAQNADNPGRTILLYGHIARFAYESKGQFNVSDIQKYLTDKFPAFKDVQLLSDIVLGLADQNFFKREGLGQYSLNTNYRDQVKAIFDRAQEAELLLVNDQQVRYLEYALNQAGRFSVAAADRHINGAKTQVKKVIKELQRAAALGLLWAYPDHTYEVADRPRVKAITKIQGLSARNLSPEFFVANGSYIKFALASEANGFTTMDAWANIQNDYQRITEVSQIFDTLADAGYLNRLKDDNWSFGSSYQRAKLSSHYLTDETKKVIRNILKLVKEREKQDYPYVSIAVTADYLVQRTDYDDHQVYDQELQHAKKGLSELGEASYILSAGRGDYFVRASDLESLEALTGDRAQTIESTGGIALDPAMLNLEIRRDGKGVMLPMSDQPIEQFMKAPGFQPMIIDIQGINLPATLGVNQEKLKKERLSLAR